MTEPIESRLQAIAREFKYPSTPAITGVVMNRLRVPLTHPRNGRQIVWALIMFIGLLAGLMVVPPARAAVLEFIQIGIVRIFPAPVATEIPGLEAPVTSTTVTNSSSLSSLLNQLSGKTTLENAQQEIGVPIPLPAYPPELGQPDRVYLQNAGGWMVILVWLDPQQPDQVQMSLHLIEEGSWTISKLQPAIIKEETVHGIRALWTVGEYPLVMKNADIQFTRMINGNVLIWEENKITYRLETSLDLTEAIRIAESLQLPKNP